MTYTGTNVAHDFGKESAIRVREIQSRSGSVIIDTQNGISIAGSLTLGANEDIVFTGTTGTNDITLTNGLADALSITDGSADVMVFDTSTAGNVITVTGAMPVSGYVRSSSATAASGYATGAGGAVTQLTDATTGVTLSKPCGQITTVALTTAAAAEERFTVTNTLVAATDCIVLSTTYNGAGTPMLSVVNVAAGAFDIVITNVHAANALNAVMVINFAVIKAVAA